MVSDKKERKMKNSNEKKITMKDEPDKKLLYLVRTLSRTKRKDYENYVVNAIWNRLNDDTLEIVTQQYIHNPKDKRGHYFIDLYFPALNIGVECDEAHHLDEENKKSDEEREKSICDALSMYNTLHQIGNKGYRPIHINVAKKYSQVEKQINDAVKTIKQKKKIINPTKWKIQNAEEFYNKRSEITIKDEVGFKTIAQASNILFNTVYPGMQHICFSPIINKKYIFEKSIYKNHKLWFPPLAIPDPNDNSKSISPKKTDYINQLIDNGNELIEKKTAGKDSLLEPADDEKQRIVFAYYENPLGEAAYRFVGIFEYRDIDDNGERHYLKKKDGDICKIKQYIYK